MNIVNIKNYTNSLLLDEPEISHFYSRGCPYDCGFCYNKKVNKRKWRVKKPEKLIKELKKIEQFGIKAVSFADEEFFIDLDKVKELCELIISNNINLKLMVSCRINDVLRFDEKFLDLLIKSGFTALYVGVESGADRVLKLINKNITKSQIISANAKLKKFKIDVYYSFMCGFPEENLEEIKDTVRLMLELYQDNKNAYILPIKAFTPYPGTELYDKCIDNGFEAPKTLEEWSKFQWNISHAKWLPNKTKRYISLVSYLTIFMDEKHVLKSKIGKRMLFLYYMAKTYAEFIRNRLVKGSFVNLDYDIVNLFRKASKFNISNLRKDICGAFSKT